MNREIFGPLPQYPPFLVLACLAGTGMTLWLAHREGVAAKRTILLLTLVTLSALVGAKFYGIVERGGGWHGISWELGSGYRYPGGIVAAAVVLPILTKALFAQVSVRALGDLAVPGVGIAMGVMRCGCVLAGCCFGIPSTLPWAIEFPAHSLAWEAHLHSGLIDELAAVSLPVHPLQIYLGAASLGVAFFLLWFRSQQQYAGQLVLLFLLLDGTAKFLLELLRFEQAAHLQWMALGQAMVGAAILLAKAFSDRRVRVMESAA